MLWFLSKSLVSSYYQYLIQLSATFMFYMYPPVFHFYRKRYGGNKCAQVTLLCPMNVKTILFKKSLFCWTWYVNILMTNIFRCRNRNMFFLHFDVYMESLVLNLNFWNFNLILNHDYMTCIVICYFKFPQFPLPHHIW